MMPFEVIQHILSGEPNATCLFYIDRSKHTSTGSISLVNCVIGTTYVDIQCKHCLSMLSSHRSYKSKIHEFCKEHWNL